MAEFDGFDFIITEEDDVMLVIYARKGNQENPVVELNPQNNSLILHRNKDDVVTLENVSKEVFDILNEEQVLLITEVVPTENELEHEIKQVYEAQIMH